MLSRLIFLTKYFLFWMVLFLTLKLIFLLYFWHDSFPFVSLWGEVFIFGFRLDLSAAGYLMLLPILLVIISVWIKSVYVLKFIKIYSYLFIALFSLLAATDLALYRAWGFRMDITPLLYLSKPKEALTTVSIWYILGHLFIGTTLSFSLGYSYNKAFKNNSFIKEKRVLTTFLLALLLGIMVIPIRGGLGKSPLSISSAYFSEVSFLNHASVNLPWNIGFSLLNMEIEENPFATLPNEEAEELAANFTSFSEEQQRVIGTQRPNIILIVLESFTANVTGCLNGERQVTPELDRLAKKGILFNNMYASGDRTDKGMLAVLSGFPAQPTSSLIKYSNKTERIPALPKMLKENNYKTYFYYGGNTEFANYRSFLINAGFEKIIELKDFPAAQRTINWGVPDEFLFQRVATDLKEIQSPFFITLFTLSSHVPYDSPYEPVIKGSTEEIKFCNSVHYTDTHLGGFIKILEDSGLLNTTLVIFVADHGFQWPGDLKFNDPKKFHIPMIWYGGALSRTDTIISTYCNQTDIAATILNQLNIRSNAFSFSKNIFALETPNKTIYSFNNGFGYVSDSLNYIYNLTSDKFFKTKGEPSETDKMIGKAFYQKVYKTILEY